MKRGNKKKSLFLIGLSFEAAFLIWASVYWGGKWDAMAGGGIKITFSLVILSLLIWFYRLIKFLKM